MSTTTFFSTVMRIFLNQFWQRIMFFCVSTSRLTVTDMLILTILSLFCFSFVSFKQISTKVGLQSLLYFSIFVDVILFTITFMTSQTFVRSPNLIKYRFKRINELIAIYPLDAVPVDAVQAQKLIMYEKEVNIKIKLNL